MTKKNQKESRSAKSLVTKADSTSSGTKSTKEEAEEHQEVDERLDKDIARSSTEGSTPLSEEPLSPTTNEVDHGVRLVPNEEEKFPHLFLHDLAKQYVRGLDQPGQKTKIERVIDLYHKALEFEQSLDGVSDVPDDERQRMIDEFHASCAAQGYLFDPAIYNAVTDDRWPSDPITNPSIGAREQPANASSSQTLVVISPRSENVLMPRKKKADASTGFDASQGSSSQADGRHDSKRDPSSNVETEAVVAQSMQAIVGGLQRQRGRSVVDGDRDDQRALLNDRRERSTSASKLSPGCLAATGMTITSSLEANDPRAFGRLMMFILRRVVLMS